MIPVFGLQDLIVHFHTEWGWFQYSTWYCRNSEMYLLRLDYKREGYCGFSIVLLDYSLWGKPVATLWGHWAPLERTTQRGSESTCQKPCEWAILKPLSSTSQAFRARLQLHGRMSQSHSAYSNSWPIELMRKCLLFKAANLGGIICYTTVDNYYWIVGRCK